MRQGDPLSPLLFVLAADLLQCIVNKACTQGLFSLPIEADPSNKFPIIQYADDTILIMKASQREIFCLKGLLQSFTKSTGLRVNYAKSQMIPLNLSHEQAINLANTFGCQIGTLPFTYLGLPLLVQQNPEWMTTCSWWIEQKEDLPLFHLFSPKLGDYSLLILNSHLCQHMQCVAWKFLLQFWTSLIEPGDIAYGEGLK